MEKNRELNMAPIGFIDDDLLKTGKRFQGFPILGGFGDIDKLTIKYNIGCLIISFNHNDPEKFKALKRICLENNLILKQFTISVIDADLEL